MKYVFNYECAQCKKMIETNDEDFAALEMKVLDSKKPNEYGFVCDKCCELDK